MTKAAVTGGTGFIGKQICAALQEPNVLTRTPESVPSELAHAACFRWEPGGGPPPPEALEGCDAVLHLAGESVADGRWTAAKRERIRSSRVVGTKNLVAGMRAMEDPPKVLVSASAVGYYGSRGDEALNEQSSPGEGFLPDICREWEASAREAEEFGTRVVTVRIGLVLGKQGGGLARMLPAFRMCAGGPLGSGQQWMAWIHVEDLARLFLFAAETDSLSGPVNGTAPNPVTNREFTRALGRAVRRPAFLPAPAFALRLALGEFAEVLLSSQQVTPDAALSAGFEFQRPTIDAAFSDL